ncbi:MAG: flagellar motor stator protein MotA [Brockia lithotrophica]|nr:flagellar motor stator protein MotA [Brockia lithotrophica]
MEISTVLGLVVAVFSIGYGVILKGVPIGALFSNPAAYLIIIGGTVAVTLNAFTMDELKRLPQLFRFVVVGVRFPDENKLIDQFMEWAIIARREGILALEAHVEEVEDPFLRNGLKMVVDGRDMEFIRDALLQDIQAMEERHARYASIFSQAGTYAPTLGVLGAVVGLIAALSHIDDTSTLGTAIASAFIATFLGIFTGYVLWHPFANKLNVLTRREVAIKLLMLEGILSLQAGMSPTNIEEKLVVFLPLSVRAAREREKEAAKRRGLEVKEGEAAGITR